MHLLNTVISSQPDKLRLFGATKGQHKSGIPSFYSSLPFSHNASQFCTDIFLRVSDSWQPAFQRMDNGSLITEEMSKLFYFLYPCAAEQGPLCSSRRDLKRIRKERRRLRTRTKGMAAARAAVFCAPPPSTTRASFCRVQCGKIILLHLVSCPPLPTDTRSRGLEDCCSPRILGERGAAAGVGILYWPILTSHESHGVECSGAANRSEPKRGRGKNFDF